MPVSTEAARKALLSRDRVTFAINHGNVILVSGNDDTGRPTGITPDLAAEMAAALSLPAQMEDFTRAVEVTESAGRGVWDICFLAVDPARAEVIAFSEPYIRITGSYLVPQGSSLTTPAQVDAPGNAIACTRGSAYALYLERNLTQARTLPFESFAQTLTAVREGKAQAVAGVTEALKPFAGGDDGLRLIDQPFMTINQAVGCSREAPELAAWIAGFIEKMRADGRLAALLRRHGVE